MAYDPLRDRVVLHGGLVSGSGAVDQTWEFDGSSWTQIATAGPGRDLEHAMVYDEIAERCVLFPRLKYELQSWDGVKWTQLPVRRKQFRYDFAVAYHRGAGTIHYHGGYGQLDSGPQSDHWRVVLPGDLIRLADYTMTRRYRHAMAYDAARDRLVIYGGDSFFSGQIADTHEWDRTSWRRLPAANEPGPRSLHQLVYHAALSRVLLIGGRRDLSPQYFDVWSWDGMVWQPMSVSQRPWRFSHNAVYDSTRQRVVVFGGTEGGTYLGDTLVLVPACKANCNLDATAAGGHKLDILDFTCFQNAFALGDLSKADLAGADCGTPDGQLSIQDFTCFQNLFALGCL